MSKLVDFLRDRVRLATRGAQEEQVQIGTWKRSAATYARAFDTVLAVVNRSTFSARGMIVTPYDVVQTPDHLTGADDRVYVMLDADSFVRVLEQTHGKDHPTTIHLRARIERAQSLAQVESPS